MLIGTDEDQIVSVLVRIHDPAGARQLHEAIQSIHRQTYPSVQAIVCIQNGSFHFMNEVADDLARLWNNEIKILSSHEIEVGRHRVISVPISAGIDGRAELLNCGFARVSGRYLAFLDFDDVLYPEAYEILVDRARLTGCGVVAGGCNRAVFARSGKDGEALVPTETVKPYLPSGHSISVAELVYANFLPIHSYIVDLCRFDRSLFVFDTRVPLLEDYKMLLKLVAEDKGFDFASMSIPICEYRMRTDGSNSVLFGEVSADKREKWNEAALSVTRLKESLNFKCNMKELSDIVQARELLLEAQTGGWRHSRVAAFLIQWLKKDKNVYLFIRRLALCLPRMR